MPSTPSDRLRIELQARGENVNSWGDTRLNEALKRLEEAVAGVLTLTITGDTVLTSQNFIADQSRMSTLVLMGTPAANFRVTIPGVQKTYNVINLTPRIANFGVADMATVPVRAGLSNLVVCDGAVTRVVDLTLDQVRTAAAAVNIGGQRITNVAAATADTDGINRGQAITITQPLVDLARNWATATTVVADGFKGARGYALDAAGAAGAASGSATTASNAAGSAQDDADAAEAALADFLNRYVVSPQFPTSGNFAGRLAFSTNGNQFGVYDSGTGAYQAITSPSQATEATLGLVRLATRAEAVAGASPSAVLTPANSNFLERKARSSNTQIVAADKASIIDASGTFTQTFASAATLGAGFNLLYANAGTGLVSFSGVSGVQSAIPSSVTLIQSDGSSIRAISLNSAAEVGVQQVWQNVTRELGIVYQNATGRPIVVSARFTGASSTISLGVSADNVSFVSVAAVTLPSGSGPAGFVTAIVPPGHFYRLTPLNSPALSSVAELR